MWHIFESHWICWLLWFCIVIINNIRERVRRIGERFVLKIWHWIVIFLFSTFIEKLSACFATFCFFVQFLCRCLQGNVLLTYLKCELWITNRKEDEEKKSSFECRNFCHTNQQGGRSWQPFSEGKKTLKKISSGPYLQSSRQLLIFAHNCKFAN